MPLTMDSIKDGHSYYDVIIGFLKSSFEASSFHHHYLCFRKSSVTRGKGLSGKPLLFETWFHFF